jgi:hypothetical protein
MWFRELVGFDERNPNQVRENLKLEGEYITSLVNGVRVKTGTLERPTLSELRSRVEGVPSGSKKIKLSQIVANVQELHTDPSNKNSMFQAASQFNLLEMVSPHISPESGIDGYDRDLTQGPACAIACGAGTIFRNYFVTVNGEAGQSSKNQIDCLKDVGIEFNNLNNRLWTMSNGYMLPSTEGLDQINLKLSSLSSVEKDRVFSKLRVGIHKNTEVTLSSTKHLVSQAYCSAVPVSYTSFNTSDWEQFARGVLNATYEATLLTAIENYDKTQSSNLYLTLVGGGVFGNKLDWILDAIETAILKYQNYPLDVKLVSYSGLNPTIEERIDSVNLAVL